MMAAGSVIVSCCCYCVQLGLEKIPVIGSIFGEFFLDTRE